MLHITHWLKLHLLGRSVRKTIVCILRPYHCDLLECSATLVLPIPAMPNIETRTGFCLQVTMCVSELASAAGLPCEIDPTLCTALNSQKVSSKEIGRFFQSNKNRLELFSRLFEESPA